MYLGEGGSIKLGFSNNTLTNSGDPTDDVYVFEIGQLVEACTLAFHPADSFTQIQLQNASIPDVDGDGYYEFGSVGGSTAGYDIDSGLPGYNSGQLIFDAIQITDVNDRPCTNRTPGADIDAVCALSFEQISISEKDMDAINMYPSPTNGNFNIDLGKEYHDITVQISNSIGQIISVEKYASTKTIQAEIKGATGIYFVKVSVAEEGSSVYRIIKH